MKSLPFEKNQLKTLDCYFLLDKTLAFQTILNSQFLGIECEGNYISKSCSRQLFIVGSQYCIYKQGLVLFSFSPIHENATDSGQVSELLAASQPVACLFTTYILAYSTNTNAQRLTLLILQSMLISGLKFCWSKIISTLNTFYMIYIGFKKQANEN